MKYRPVTIFTNSFAFCRYSVAVLLWLAFWFHIPALLLLTEFIFIFSAILGVDRAPLIWLYSITLGKLEKNPQKVVVDIHDIRFVHVLASVFNSLVLIILLLGNPIAYRITLLIFASLKTASALGYCPASRLRTCVLGNSGSCCRISYFKNLRRNC